MSVNPAPKEVQIEEEIDLNYSKHRRLSEFERLVYPVVSRRSGGLSLGINLNPTKKCTFDCVYCQVDRKVRIENLEVDLTKICQELAYWINLILEKDKRYRGYPLKDISIAGDGEPTTVNILPALMKKMIEFRSKYNLESCKLILFTNGSNIDRSDLDDILPEFIKNNGEIWFKLDYWDQESLTQINRTKVSAERLINNLRNTGSKFPLILQSCFFSWKGEKYQNHKYEKYVKLIRQLLKEGVQIDRIQAYTLARTPAEKEAVAWSNEEMDLLVKYLQNHLAIAIEKYYADGNND